jgi:hypothetical protein
MPERFAEHIARLTQLVTTAPGKTTSEMRAAVHARARRLVSSSPAPVPPGDNVPASLSPYVESVLRHAYRITDQEVATLRQTQSDDVIFETTVNAAVGAGIARLERALALLKGDRE